MTTGSLPLCLLPGKVVFDQDQRASWFSHKAEVAKPYYYKVYLADHDVTTEIAPTRPCGDVSFHFPRDRKDSYVSGRCFRQRFVCESDSGREQDHRLHNSSNSGGVPENFKQLFCTWCSISRSLLPQQLPTATSVTGETGIER